MNLIHVEIYDVPIEKNLIFFNFDEILNVYFIQINFKNFLPQQKEENHSDTKKPLRIKIAEIGEKVMRRL